MEIRCSNCQHVGPAADVVQSDDGLLFVCENCGHENPVSVPKAATKPKVPVGETSESDHAGSSPSGAASRSQAVRDAHPAETPERSEAKAWLEDARARLIPEPGDGPRCPKCLNLVGYESDLCQRCGLDLERARRFAPGDAPWETAPSGREAEWEQAELLWASAIENPSHDALEKFVTFVKDEQLAELGVRRLREWLVEHPDDERAIGWLEEIAATFQARIMVARAQARMSADKFSESTQKFKKVLVVIAALYLTVLLIVAAAWFMA